MKEQQEKIRVLDPHIILILFISAFVFGIGILMINVAVNLVLYENCCAEQRRLYGILAVLEEKL